jgi:DNA-binding NarL/FixJ family response regulator
MQRTGALDVVLTHVVESRASDAVAEAGRLYDETGDAYILGLLAFTQFVSQRWDDAVASSQRALSAATDAESLMLARAAAGIAAAGASVEGDPLADARAELHLLDEVDGDSAMFIRYLLAEAALDCARLRLAGEFVDSSPALSPSFLERNGSPHPYFTIMQVMVIRVLAFQGRITEAITYRETAVVATNSPLPTLLMDATMCLVHGNAAQKSTVRALAVRLERQLPEPRDYLSSGGYLLVAFGLIATGDVREATRFILIAGNTPGLECLTIVDRALGLEMLLVSAIAEDDLVSAQAWLARAEPLSDLPIARPTIERMHSRVALLAGDAASAATWAERAIEHARADGRAVEAAEGEIVLSRARISLSQRGQASAQLEAMATLASGDGHMAARQSAARELRNIGRRLRPRPGSGFDGLSARERDVALLIVEGFSNGAIASELHLSEHTVQVHVSRVLAAFGVASRFALAAQLADILPQSDEQLPPPAALTPRQNAVVDRIVLGLSNDQIGRELGVSIKTVEKHVSEVFRRWDVASRIGVSRLARLRGPDVNKPLPQ